MNKLLRLILLCACFLLFVSNSRAQSTLIHYWNFNTLAGPYIHPNIPHIQPDYTALTPDSAYLEYYLLPGTSATWAISGPDANNASGAQIDNVAGDTTNARQGDPAGTGIRFRNPTDSAELHWHIPSTGFSNLVVKFATQTSSVASGDSVQDYSYSVDGGKTWDSTGMTVNGASGHTLDLTQGGSATTIYLNFAPVTVTFGSATTVNNNPNLIFRIIFQGNTHPGFPVTGTNQVSGNNRFDNFTLDGVGSSGPPPPPPAKITMATPTPGGGNIFVPGQKTLISFHANSTVGQVRTIQFSTNGGTTWTSVGKVTDPGDTTYTWTIPNTATTEGFVNVTDSAGVTAKAGPFIIYQIPSNNLIVDYWAFNTLSGAYYTPNVPNLPADFTAPGTPGGYIQYVNFAKIANWSYIDNVAGDAVFTHLGAPAGNALRVRNPTDSMELHFVIPTTGFKGISISYALQASSTTGPQVEHFTYSTDGGTDWITSGMTVNGSAQDTLDVTQSQYQQSAAPGAPYGPVTIGFGSQTSMDDNPNFVFRIVFGDTATGGTSGNNRFDNLTVSATSASAGVDQPAGQLLVCSAFPSPTQDYISILCPEQGRKNISITDITGRMLATFSESQEQYNYDVRDLASGTYFIHIQAMSGEQATLRFVKE